MFRVTVTVHAITAFAQPALAGAYLSGNIDGLSWHARIADAVSYLGMLQLVIAIVVSIRAARWWPAVASALLVAAEFAQYVAGMSGALWLHIPLGVTIIAAVTLMFAVVWMRPLPLPAATRKRSRKSNELEANPDA